MNSTTKTRKSIRHAIKARKIKPRTKSGTFQDSIYPTPEERGELIAGAKLAGESYSGFLIRSGLARTKTLKAKAAKTPKAKAKAASTNGNK